MPTSTPKTSQGHNALLRTLASRTHAEAVEIGRNAADFMEQLSDERTEMLTALKAALNHCDRETTHMIETLVKKLDAPVRHKRAAI